MNLSFLYCHSGACSQWSQGGTRITGLYGFLCRWDTASYYIVTTVLAPNGDRAVPALFDLLYCHHDACSSGDRAGPHY